MDGEVSENVAWLVDGSGRSIPIRGSCSVGRTAANQVALPDERVSRRHAIIQPQGENEYWVVDLGSRNGTYLNDRRVMHPTRLRNGDRLRFGPFDFAFRQPGSETHVPSATTLANQTIAEIRPAQCWLLVADILNSSRLVQELPPDELPRVTGQWVAECKLTLESCGGRINQFMGDGFFAYWHDRPRTEIEVEKGLAALRRLQETSRPPFRLALHLGPVMIGGLSVGEEERISGGEVHFVFRMEKLAGSLSETRLLSESAWKRLEPLLPTSSIGPHPLAGFDGEHRFYRF